MSFPTTSLLFISKLRRQLSTEFSSDSKLLLRPLRFWKPTPDSWGECFEEVDDLLPELLSCGAFFFFCEFDSPLKEYLLAVLVKCSFAGKQKLPPPTTSTGSTTERVACSSRGPWFCGGGRERLRQNVRTTMKDERIETCCTKEVARLCRLSTKAGSECPFKGCHFRVCNF